MGPRVGFGEDSSLPKNLFSGSEVMTTTSIKITNEVFIAPKLSYMIRINKEFFGWVSDEKIAIEIVKKLADSEIKKLTHPAVKVFRQDLKEGREVKLSTQAIGYLYNGRVMKAVVFDIVEVPQAILTALPADAPKVVETQKAV